MLAAFLHSRFGQVQVNRLIRGAVQMGLPLADFDQILVPSLGKLLSTQLTKLVKGAHAKQRESNNQLEKAEQTLLRALNLSDWAPPQELSYQAAASEAFKAGRLDSEFFEPRFLAMEHKLKSLPFEVLRLGDLVLPLRNGADFRDFIEVGTPYIRVGDIKKGRILLESAKKVLPTREESGKQIQLLPGNVLLTRKGSFGNAAVVERGMEHAIISSEIILIRIEKSTLLPEYLAAFLNSCAGKLQAERYSHGAAFYSVAQQDVENFLIPVLPMDEQVKIVEQTRSSAQLESDSISCLNRATRATEIAIEEGEDAAMAFLDDGKEFIESRLLPDLFHQRHYVNTDAVRDRLKAEGVTLEPDTVKSYLHDWMQEGRVFDAGRGWYSDLPEPMTLPVTEGMQRILDWTEQAFPLLDVQLWSTEQTAPFQQHLPSSHLIFVYVDRENLRVVADRMRADLNLRISLHPLAEEAESFRADEWDVVLRPLLSSDAEEGTGPSSISSVLVDLAVEADRLGFLGSYEYETIFSGITNSKRIAVSQLIHRCKARKTDLFGCLKQLDGSYEKPARIN